MDSLLAELFASRIRAAVLARMMPRPHIPASLTDLARALDLPISSLQHECYKLDRIGVLTSVRDRNSRYYSVNPESPIRRELTALVATAIGQDVAAMAGLERTPGLAHAFASAVLPLPGPIEPAGPLKIVLIGEIPLEEIDAAHLRLADLLGSAPSAIDPVFYLTSDWNSRKDQQNAYVMNLLAGPRTDLAGSPGG